MRLHTYSISAFAVRLGIQRTPQLAERRSAPRWCRDGPDLDTPRKEPFSTQATVRRFAIPLFADMAMKPEVEIYDTTLRDGSQGEGVNFSVMDKMRIAEKLDAFGVHYIEGGWPGSNPKDIEFFAGARRKKFKNARLAAFGSTRKKSVPVERDDQVRLLIEAATPVVTIYGKTSMLHVKEELRCAPDENLALIGHTV